jgi:hypothetical protein
MHVLFTTLRQPSHFLPLIPFIEACQACQACQPSTANAVS